MLIVNGGMSYKNGVYLSEKSDTTTISAFDDFCIKAETLTGRKIRRLRTDRTFESAAWEAYCKTHGITHEFTAPYFFMASSTESFIAGSQERYNAVQPLTNVLGGSSEEGYLPCSSAFASLK